MEDLLINIIAPLCPFLYVTLRCLNRKFRTTLPLARVKEFLAVSHLYVTRMKDPYVKEIHEEIYRVLIKGIIPTLRNREISIIPWPRDKSKIAIDVDGARIMRDHIIGRQRHDDFFEYLCKMYGCRLNCCSSVWETNRRIDPWLLSFDDAIWPLLVFKVY